MDVSFKDTPSFQQEYQPNLPQGKTKNHQYILWLDKKTGKIYETKRYSLYSWIKRIFSIFTSSTYHLPKICHYLKNHQKDPAIGELSQEFKDAWLERVQHYDQQHHSRLYAKMLQVFKSTHTSSSSQSVKQEDTETKRHNFSIKQEIKDFVTSFLHPYIMGQIRPEDEPENRKPMMKLLMEKLGKIEFLEIGKEEEALIEQIAFDAYLNTATSGLYLNRRKEIFDMIEVDSTEFSMLVDALMQAIPKDFPSKNLSKEELESLLSIELDQLNVLKAKEIVETHDFLRAGESKDRYKKLAQLEKHDTLWYEPSASHEEKFKDFEKRD